MLEQPQASDLFDGEGDGLAVDVPLFCEGQGLAVADGVSQHITQQGGFVLADQGLQLLVAAQTDADVVGDFKAAVFAHGLDLGDQFSDEPFVDERGGEVGVQHQRDAAVGVGDIAVDLHRGDEQVVAGQLCRTAVGKGQGDAAGLVQFRQGLLPVDGGKGGLDLAKPAAVFGADGLELWLEGRRSEGKS